MLDPLVLRLFLILSLFSAALKAGPLADAINTLDMQLLAATYSDGKIDRLLDDTGSELSASDRRAAAVLVTLGVLRPADLDHPPGAQKKIQAYLEIVARNHPARLGRVGDAGLLLALDRDWQHDELVDDRLVEILAAGLTSGVITGYDVRRQGIYDGFAPGGTLIYSHSSRLHLKQLLALLAAEGLSAWVYATPKTAAFLYREEWGTQSNGIRILNSGVRIIEGQEIAVLFRFDSSDDRVRFHELILKYAKRDSKDETGLIASAWWQPFYYTDAPLAGFEPISLVILGYGGLEATLTVLEARTGAVVNAFRDSAVSQRIQRVWVNPAFHRFLKGDFK